MGLAGVGQADRPPQARHQRRAVLEADAVPVHGPVLAPRALRAVAVDGHIGGDLAERADLRLADRVPPDLLAPRAPLRLLRGRAVRRAVHVRDAGPGRQLQLHALRAERGVRHDDRVALPAGDRPAYDRPPPGRLLDLVAGRPGPARGV